MIAIIDYDAGNIRSVEKALEHIGEKAIITRDKNVINQADKIVFPGVGAFGVAVDKLKNYELFDVLKDNIATGKPFLGICLGMQLLFESSEESPEVQGLSVLKGRFVRIPSAEGLKIPQIGWNSLDFTENESLLFEGIPEASYMYFVHSYYLIAEDFSDVTATTEYGTTLQVSVHRNNVYGCQFHPEKSGDIGLKLLRNFCNIK